MNTRELRTNLEKAETQAEIVVRKAETKLRQPENSQVELRLFHVYQLLTSISQRKLNFLRETSHTTIVDSAPSAEILVWTFLLHTYTASLFRTLDFSTRNQFPELTFDIRLVSLGQFRQKLQPRPKFH